MEAPAHSGLSGRAGNVPCVFSVISSCAGVFHHSSGYCYGFCECFFRLLSPLGAIADSFAHQILAGGGVGGLTLSPVIRVLLSSVGGRWTLRIYALFNLAAGLPIAWAVPRSRFAGSSTADGPER